MPILELEGVSVGSEREGAPIEDVGLTLERGEVLAVVSLDLWGGRTTLLETSAGLLEPTRGAVRLDGVDLYRLDFAAQLRARKRVGVVLESTGLLQNLTIWENVALPLRYHAALGGRELTVKVERLLEKAGFTEDPHVLPWRVSGRGRRLAAFARALARDPDLVVIDGFFEGLEMPDWRRLFEVVIDSSRAERTAWLLACEIDPVIFSLADTVAVLERGRVIQRGTRRQLFEDRRIEQAFLAADASTLRRKSQRWTSLRTPTYTEADLEGMPAPELGGGGMETIDVGAHLTAERVREAARDPFGDPDATLLDLGEPARPPAGMMDTIQQGPRATRFRAGRDEDWERSLLDEAKRAQESGEGIMDSVSLERPPGAEPPEPPEEAPEGP
jgi:ABC-type transporter Mla maintaining outer membrane lipid asymmetry ATPase subunit MlaF